MFDHNIATVIINAYRFGFSVKSDFARKNAEYVAMAASMGLITTKVVANVYGREWRTTAQGLSFLHSLDLPEDDDE